MRKAASVLGILALIGMIAIPALSAADKKTHEMTVTVVSADAKAKTITFKDDKGKESTAPVLAEAAGSLTAVKSGDKVILTCEDDDKGMHKGVSAIRPAA